MKVSIITITYNSAKTVRDTLQSIANQSYKNIEHIVVDGASKDNTLDIVREFPNVKVLSEPDEGIYDAMNKGVAMTTGDIVGILNSDDFYSNNDIIQTVVDTFIKEKVDSVYGDIVFVNPDDLNKVTRRYSSANWYPEKMAAGYMPAHPSFFVKRIHYEKIGNFKVDYAISADYELLIRFLYVNRISYHYINEALVTMRTGGASNQSLKSVYVLNKEVIRACRENGIKMNYTKLGFKYFNKLLEFVNPK